MVQRGRGLGLAAEAAEEGRVARQVLAQHLDGDVAAEPRVAGPVDLGHAAVPEQLTEPIAAGQQPYPGRLRRALESGTPEAGSGLPPEPSGIGSLRARIHSLGHPPRLVPFPGSGLVTTAVPTGPVFWPPSAEALVDGVTGGVVGGGWSATRS